MHRLVARGSVPLVALSFALLLAPTNATAGMVTHSATSGTRAASAQFETSGTNLIVTLTNTSTFDVMVPIDVLTGVFFDVDGVSLSLSRVSAIVPNTSTVQFGGTDAGGVVGGEWAYKSGLSGAPGSNSYGISSSGLGLFGPGDLFAGTNLQGPSSPDGLQYGISSAGDNPATGNTPVTGSNALIQNEVVFTFSGLPQNFDVGLIRNVIWQYGTDLSEPTIPEPGTLALLAIAGGSVVVRRRRA